MPDLKSPRVAQREAGRQRQLPRGLPVIAVIAVAVIAFLAGGSGGSYENKLIQVEKNDNASYLPGSAESTQGLNEWEKFLKVENLPGFMIFQRDGGLTAADRDAAGKLGSGLAATSGVDTAAAAAPAQFSADNSTASVFVPLI